MKKLLITFLGAAFVVLNATSAQASAPVASITPQLTEKAPAAQDAASGSGSLIKTSFNPRTTDVTAASSANAVDASPDQWSRNGLSMLAALAMIGGIVLRRFLR